jgi:hypothetical protein
VKAGKAVEAAPDAAAKLTAAEEFVKKYPKSTSRPQLAQYLVEQIAVIPDAAQRLALAERFQKTFTGEDELSRIRPILISSYIITNRVDDAFNLGATILASQSEDIRVLSQLAIAGANEAKKRNGKYMAQSQQYGLKAIELIEGDKKPGYIDDALWAHNKSLLPQLYQQTAVLALITGKSADARMRAEKAAALNPNDPFNYVLLGTITDDEYQQLAKTYGAMPESQAKQEMLKKIGGLMDSVVDSFAHVVALTAGRPEYKELETQIMQGLTSYYKYRHNQSTDGLQQLIDKYKVQPKP